MTDLQREHNGRTILDLCELGDRILASYGIPPEPAKECGCFGRPYGWRGENGETQVNGHAIPEQGACATGKLTTAGSNPAAKPLEIPCDECGGSGLVPANSGSDVADFKCQECNGKGVRP